VPDRGNNRADVGGGGKCFQAFQSSPAAKQKRRLPRRSVAKAGDTGGYPLNSCYE
jgi:hypothetical protein